MVLIHGWSCDGNYWKEQIAPLKAKYTTVTVDLAGHGASGANRTDWSMGNFGEDVAAVVRQIHNQKVVLVGHSMGAPVALEAARRIGDRVGRASSPWIRSRPSASRRCRMRRSTRC